MISHNGEDFPISHFPIFPHHSNKHTLSDDMEALVHSNGVVAPIVVAYESSEDMAERQDWLPDTCRTLNCTI